MNNKIYYIKKYLKDIGAPTLLATKKEKEMLEQYSNSKDYKIINKLVLNNQYIILEEVLYFCGQGIEIDDLIQYGNLFCIEAFKNYTFDKGNLKNYLHRNIYRGFCNINPSIVSLIYYPMNIVGALKSYINDIEEYKKTNDSQITNFEIEQIAQQNNLNIDVINQLWHNESFFEGKIVQLDDFTNILFYNDSTHYHFEEISLKHEIHEQLSDFKKRDSDVIKYYFGLDNIDYTLTFNEIGEDYNLTRERVRQIKEKIIEKLSHISRSKHLKIYLNINNNIDYEHFEISDLPRTLFEISDEEKQIIEILKKYTKPRKRKTKYKNISNLLRKKILEYVNTKKKPCHFSDIFNHIVEILPEINPMYITYALNSSNDLLRIQKGLYGTGKMFAEYKKHNQQFSPDFSGNYTTRESKPKIVEINIDYITECNKSEIELTENVKTLINQIMKKDGSISSIRLESLSTIKRIDFNSEIYKINSIFRDKFSIDFIQYDEITKSWEINSYFNYFENWQQNNNNNIVCENTVQYQKNDPTECPDFLNEESKKIENIFTHTVTTYKFYWFLSILTLVEKDRKEASFHEMAALMCAHAWKDVLVKKNSFVCADQLPKIIRKIYLYSNLKQETNMTNITNYL